MLRLARALPLTLCALALAGCPRAGDDDDDIDDLGGLDTDGDGVLSADDLSPGSAGFFVDFLLQDDEGEPLPTQEGATSVDVSLSPASAAWDLTAVVEMNGTVVSYLLRFENAGVMQPDLGAGAVTNASASAEDNSFYAYVNENDAQVEVTAASAEVASGQLDGDLTMEVLGEFEQPTGETVVLRGFAFRDVPLSFPMR